MNKILLATSPTTSIPTPEISSAYESLYTDAEIATIKSAYNTGQIFFGLFNEKTRIDGSANNFINAQDKSYWRWTEVITSNGTVQDNDSNAIINAANLRQIRDASFVAFATDNNALKTIIKDELLAQSLIYNTNLSNPIWVQGRYADRDIIFKVAGFFADIIACYLYIESAFSSLEKSDFFDNYIIPSIDFIEGEINNAYTILLGRNVANRTLPPYSLASFSTNDDVFTYKNSSNIKTNRTTTLMRRYNNRRNGFMLRAVLLAYIATNKISYANSCYMSACETLAYGWFADGSFNEFHRSGDWNRTSITGMGYSTLIMSTAIATAWVLWRKNNDPSLFQFTTNVGANGTEGGAKSLLWACKEYPKYFNNTYERYKWKNNIDYLNESDPNNPIPNPLVQEDRFTGRVGSQRIITDATLMAIPLLDYYRSDTDLQNQITRTGATYSNVSWVSPVSQTNYWGGENNAGIFQFPASGGFASVLLEIYSLLT